jgi:hypothetical protein
MARLGATRSLDLAQVPLAIEILDLGRGEPVVVDRVTGATVYMEEAKRIGRHLLSLTGP